MEAARMLIGGVGVSLGLVGEVAFHLTDELIQSEDLFLGLGEIFSELGPLANLCREKLSRSIFFQRDGGDLLLQIFIPAVHLNQAATEIQSPDIQAGEELLGGRLGLG